jgi:hypothetical protein
MQAIGDDEAAFFAFGGNLEDKAGTICDSLAVVDGGFVIFGAGRLPQQASADFEFEASRL